MAKLIEPGLKAPAFFLPDQNGNKHRLSAYKGQTVILYFYPRDNTSGCTTEACEFRDIMPRFNKLDIPVFGISPDSSKSHKLFADKFNLNFILLADEKNDNNTPPICDKYGVWQEKKMYGKSYQGIVRTTYIIGIDGKIMHRFDKVKPQGHAENILSILRDNQ